MKIKVNILMINYKKSVQFIKKLYSSNRVFLHEPKFIGNEKKYLLDCVDSTFVSSVGKYVDEVEKEFASYVGSKYAIALVNGTNALHLALKVAGVEKNSEVITQALSFVATSNAISYCGAKPIFLDVDKNTLGLSPKALKKFLQTNCKIKDGICINKTTNKPIKAIVPMHTFGHPCKIDKIVKIASQYNIAVVEDSAESLGSFYKNKHTGTFGKLGIFSFNGNKIITSGGGGMVVTDDENLAKKLKHLSTTAKIPHRFEYNHDKIGYNYRMPNINAALLLAQLENLDKFLKSKRKIAKKYKKYFKNSFIVESKNSRSNYWLNGIILKNKKQRDKFLNYTNKQGVMSRPIWKLLSELKIYKNCQKDNLKNSKYLEKRVVNIPSGSIV
jgi:aminotransferase in exopolysaccharide biosynthesis